MTNFRLRAASAALFLAVGGLAFAADPPPPPGAAPLTPAPVATYRAKQVLGTKILLRNDTSVGTVDDIVFDDAGNLEHLVVATSDNKLITVPWEAAKFDLEKKTAVVNITPEVYKTIPTYTVTTYPAFYTPAYRTDIYRVYGLTPRELRRIERRLP
jgi:sporulation protein YlmC with PRC-barrel domain